MILRRVLSGAAAAGAAAAAAAVVVIGLAYALYALAKTWLPPAGAAAVTAAAFALVLGIGAAVMASGAKGKGKAGGRAVKKLKHPHDEPRTLMERALDTARERPVVAAAGALAAGLLALRNPALVATVIGLINQPPRPRRD